MGKRYRYITCGLVNPDDHISNYRLVGANQISGDNGTRFQAIRFEVPSDMVLEKWSCDNYSTTKDTRTLNMLGYDILVKFNGKWKICNELKDYQPHEFSTILQNKGFYLVLHHGYLTKEQYKKWFNQKGI